MTNYNFCGILGAYNNEEKHVCFSGIEGWLFVIEKSNISEVKKNIEGYIGQKVLLRGSLGRNKTFEKEGTLLNAYPNHFLVRLDDGIIKENFSYVDVLSNRVELEIADSNGAYSSILNNAGPNITM